MGEKTGTSSSRAIRNAICSERARCGLLRRRTEDLPVTGKQQAVLPPRSNHDEWLAEPCPLRRLAEVSGLATASGSHQVEDDPEHHNPLNPVGESPRGEECSARSPV